MEMDGSRCTLWKKKAKAERYIRKLCFGNCMKLRASNGSTDWSGSNNKGCKVRKIGYGEETAVLFANESMLLVCDITLIFVLSF